ncbi:hypothetical protein ZOSMA_40G00180 [Zostera marina]|uniref:carnosine N-methyltransferase n=1 Tax=Zostera marina TaxID=29655 RepID=A0A0K9P5B6_ZOSMR|nr:hypothetical protein ZOSMA_40G00180 [Zostera marina]
MTEENDLDLHDIDHRRLQGIDNRRIQDIDHYRHTKEEEDLLELKSLRRIIDAYVNYSDAAEKDVRNYERSYEMLSSNHKAILSHLPLKYQRLRQCISVNSSFIMNMLQAFQPPIDMSCGRSCFETTSNYEKGSVNFGKKPISSESDGKADASHVDCSPLYCFHPPFQVKVPFEDVDKVRCIIRNIVRDWGNEGEKERDQCYKPILEELDHLFPLRFKESPPACLVPGAGLGRLALEISRLGFICEGNEFSYYMMICSSFIINQTQMAGEWKIYPWIHNNCNSLSDNDQLRGVSFPDIHPASAGITDGFSMCGGEFVDLYKDVRQKAKWDAVVTCFFLDTAHNIVEYIEVISKILKDDGVWINIGPLLYHFADSHTWGYGMSIELSLEDVKNVALHYGFEMQMEKTIETTYTANHRSMMQTQYSTVFWTMKKKQQSTKSKASQN